MNLHMPVETETKVVQTELPAEEYERLVRVSEREGLSLKEALRQAASEYVARNDRHNPDDPFFQAPADGGRAGRSEDLTAADTDAYLYE